MKIPKKIKKGEAFNEFISGKNIEDTHFDKFIKKNFMEAISLIGDFSTFE